MNEIRKVVVTGSNGFIGRHLCRQLDAPGIELQSTRRRLSKSHTGDHYDNHIDVTNIDKLHESIKEADIIVHLAAKSSVPDSFNNPYETYYTNILGTLNLLELARRRNVSNFLFISTYIYGQPKYLPVDEKHQVNPHSPYQRSKLAAEKLCENYSHDFGVNVVTLRPFYVYGPNSRSYSFISSAIRQIKNSGTVVLSGERTARDFLYVSDLVKLIEIIIKNFPKGYNVYNVGYGKSHTLKEVSELLGDILNKKVEIKYDDQMRQGDITSMVADISKVSAAFMWRPLVDLKDGLNLIVATLDDISSWNLHSKNIE